jgi:hypothetical protein
MTLRASISALCFGIVLLGGCASTGSEMTPAEIQALQTHEFEAPKKAVFAAVVSVFQDLGYIVDDADIDTGIVTSSGASVDKTNFFELLGGYTSSGRTRATAFVEEIRPDLVTVRLNFVETEDTTSSHGQRSSKDRPVVDPRPYEAAFARIEEAVSVRLSAGS